MANVLDDLQLTLGEPVDYAVTPPPVGDNWSLWSGEYPPGITADYYVTKLEGTPTEAGEWALTLQPTGGYGDPVGDPYDWTIRVAGPVEVIAPPAAQSTEDGYILPEVEGVEWWVNDEPTPPGSYSVLPVEEIRTVTILPKPLEGYEFDPPADPLVLTFEPAPDPEPDPEPTPEPAPEWPDPDVQPDDGPLGVVLDAAAARITKTLRWAGEERTAAAREAYEIVLLTAWGYTRGRGFGDALVPVYPIGRVIDMAAIRLANNPEQLQRWQISGDSETLTAFQGFTLAERHVLDRYRRRSA